MVLARLSMGNFIAELQGLFMQPTVKTLALNTSVELHWKSLCPLELVYYYLPLYLCSVQSVLYSLENRDVMRSLFQKAELLILAVMQQIQLRKEGQE